MITVRMAQYSRTVTADMLWTGPNVTAVECACTIALLTISKSKTVLSMEYVHVVGFVQKSIRNVV